jgi:hypothetical protein
MTDHEKFLALLVACAQMDNKKLHPIVTELYLKSFKELGPEVWVKALEGGIKSNKLPLIADVEKAAGMMELGDDDLALEAAETAWAAIGKFGWPNGDAARAWMGPLAWDTINASGSWETICASATDDQKTYQITQWKQTAKRLLKQSDMVRFDEKQLKETIDFVKFVKLVESQTK